jgi:hypothetical protein
MGYSYTVSSTPPKDGFSPPPKGQAGFFYAYWNFGDLGAECIRS